MPIKNNTASLQQLLEAVNNLPDAGSGGIELPNLTNPAAENEIFLNKQTIDANGKVKTGTFTIESELNEQDELLAELEEILNTKSAAGEPSPILQSKTVSPTTSSQTITADSGYDGLKQVTINAIPNEYIIPSGTLTITTDGIHDVKNYASVEVNISSSGGGSSSDVEISLLTREITSYSNPTLTSLGAYAFSGTKVTSLNLPALTTIAGYTFYECTTLTTVTFPLLTEIPYNGFRQFKGLVKADLPALKKIGSNGCYQCTNLETLILRSNTVCTLASGSVLTASKIINGTGYIYVPAALIDTYKTATNWVSFADQFRAIEDYPDICG